MSVKREEGAVIAAVLLFLILIPSLGEAQTTNVYCVAGAMCYNGSTMGYIMSYTNTSGLGTQGRQYLRVAFSVDRPVFQVGDHIGVMIRTDGYFTRDSGWWYIVRGADINLTLYYPNNTLIKGASGLKSDDTGVYRDEVFALTDKSFPFGRYRFNTSVRGPATGATGRPVSLSMLIVNNSFATVFFDLGGELSITMQGLPDVNKGTNVSINGTVLQPNGQVFNSTYVLGVPGFSSYQVNISIIRPDGLVDRSTNTTSSGSFAYKYNTSGKPVGKYYAVADVEYDLGNQVERGKHTMGRTFQIFAVYGTWPEVGLAISPSGPLFVLLVITHFFFLRGVKRLE